MNDSTLDIGGLAASSSAPAARVNVPFEFRATGGEYFRIWIVNLLLTIVTLGIYSAWAKVRRLRYFYGSTLLDGHSFEYHAKPLAILKGRLIVFAAYVVFIVITKMCAAHRLPVPPVDHFWRALDHHARAPVPDAHDLVSEPAFQLPWNVRRRIERLHRLVLHRPPDVGHRVPDVGPPPGGLRARQYGVWHHAVSFRHRQRQVLRLLLRHRRPGSAGLRRILLCAVPDRVVQPAEQSGHGPRRWRK